MTAAADAGGAPTVATCPVCRRAVGIVGIVPVFRPHHDNAGAPCPMAGHPNPTNESEYA